jgi:ubiquitin carboxyl-terminal hydrolase 36/42
MFNMGNTCYLNSTLQALFHTPALYNYLMSGAHSKQCKANNGYLQTCLICALTATLRDTLQTNVIRPNRIYEKLKLICKHLVHGRQEDAHEFLR